MDSKQKTPNVGLLRLLASVISERFRWFGSHGQSFDGSRSLYTALGYKKLLLPVDFRSRYERNGVAARIVNTFPQVCWRGGANLYEDEDPKKKTPFEQAFEDLDKKLHVWSVFERVDKLAGLGRYAVIILGGPGANLEQPLQSCTFDQLKYLTPLSEEDATVDSLDTNVDSERYGLPEFYSIGRRTSGGNTTVTNTKRVHWTRVIHVADGVLDEVIFGKPRLLDVWNLLDDLEKVTGAGAEAFWKRADGGMQVEIDPTVEFTEDDKTKLNDALEKYTQEQERIIRTRGAEIKRLGSDVADFRGPTAAIFDQLSAATGIPQRILMGSERGELASTGDRSNFHDAVSDRRSNFCMDQVIRPFVERMIELGVLPKPKEYEADWPDLNKLNEEKRATVAVQIANVNKQFDGQVITAAEMRERYLDLPPLTPDQVAQLEAERQQKQEEQLAQQEAQSKLAQRYAGDPVGYVAALADEAAEVIYRAAMRK